MMRKAIGVSFLVLATVGGVMACSGDSKDEATGKSGSSGSGGASSAGSGGANSQSGNATSGSNAGLCAGKMNMCVDDQTVSGCDPTTGMDVTVNCADDIPEGFINAGCDVGSQGVEVCLIDVEDPVCLEGAAIFAVCAAAPLQATEDDLIGYYLGCYIDMNGAKTIIPCYIDYVNEATQTVDCEAADAACLPGLGGGGAPSDGGAGPGPDPMGGAGGAD